MAQRPMGDQPGRARVETGTKRVRAYLGGECIADTTAPRLVWEKPYYPAYYFPEADVRTELLRPSSRRVHSPSRGEAQSFHVEAGGARRQDAAWTYPKSPVEELRGLIRLDWAAMDAWFEEDEEVFVHPRNPYTRVDVLESSRHVAVLVHGEKVADTRRPKILFETGLAPRYYLPKTDVRMDLLVPTDTETHCPYKGTARYWSVCVDVDTVPDLAWSYPAPLAESIKVAGLVCFFDERAEVVLDGERVTRRAQRS